MFEIWNETICHNAECLSLPGIAVPVLSVTNSAEPTTEPTQTRLPIRQNSR